MRACVRAALVTLVVSLPVMVAGVAPASGAPGYAAQLRRYPYATDLVGTSVVLNWATDRSGSAASTRWGAVNGSSCTPTNSVTAARTSITVNGVAEYQWKAVVAFPASGSYCYRVFLGSTDLLGSDPSPALTTQVPVGSGAPYSFDVFGDWGQTDANGNNADTANLVHQIAASGARFAVSVGDNGYPAGSQTNDGDLVQKGQDLGAIFGPAFWTVPGRSLPLFVAPGNHGLSSGTATRSTEEINWPQDVAVSTSDGSYDRETYCCVNGTASANYASAWYAFDAGNARFYVLNASWADGNPGNSTVYGDDYAAHWTPSSPEYQWLQSDLTSHARALKLAFFHYPLRSDQKAQSSDTFLQGPSSLEGLLVANGVDLAFNGHAHIYERNTPAGAGTLASYVTGGGGGTLEPVAEAGCGATDAYAIGWSPTKSKGSKCGAAPVPDSAARVFHFLKVTVNGTSVTVAPTDELGRTFDVVTYSFAGGPPDTSIDSGPASLTNATTASFGFHSPAGDATFQCGLDGAAFTACASPKSYSGLAQGPHTFAVRATASGGTDPSPATSSWTVDLTPPTVPTALTGTTQPGLVNLSWNASSDGNGVGGYWIVRNGVLVGLSLSTTFTDSSVAPSTTYSYQVSASDRAGNFSALSAPANVTTQGGVTPVFADGFESGSLSAWTSSGGLTVTNSVKHSGSFAAQANTTNGATYAKKTLPATYTDAYSRVWFDPISAASQMNLVRYRTASDTSIGYLFLNPSGALGFHDDITATTAMSSKTVPFGSGWHSLELHTIVNGTGSTVEVWLDGSPVTDLGTTGANLGTTPVAKLQIGEVQTGRTYDVAFDDTAFATQRLGP